MARYPSTLPQLADRLFLTDGGLETTLIFPEGIELPDFAAFHLLNSPEGARALRTYYRTYAELAAQFGVGLILESPTPVGGAAPRTAGERVAHEPRDAGDPAEFGREHAALKARLPRMTVLGGCCGTDHRHVEQIAAACLPLFPRPS